jgi:hypothetical protein
VDGGPVAEASATEGPPPLPAGAGASALPPPLPRAGTASAGLGNLAQSARGKELKNARVIMLFVGILTLAVNGFFFVSAEGNVQAEIDKEIRKLPAGFVADPVKVAQVKSEAVRATRAIAAGGAFLGILFLICASLVQTYPVPVTITSLCLYLGGNAVFGMMDPSTLASGIIIKVAIVFGLFKAVQAALAYQKEQAAVAGA